MVYLCSLDQPSSHFYKCQSHLEGLLGQTAGLHPQSLWLSRSLVGPQICTYKKFPGDVDVVGPGTIWEPLPLRNTAIPEISEAGREDKYPKPPPPASYSPASAPHLLTTIRTSGQRSHSPWSSEQCRAGLHEHNSLPLPLCQLKGTNNLPLFLVSRCLSIPCRFP